MVHTAVSEQEDRHSCLSEGVLVYGQSFRDRLLGTLRNMPWWVLSICLHALILVFAWHYTWDISLPEAEMRFRPQFVKEPEVIPVAFLMPKPEVREAKADVKRQEQQRREQIEAPKLPEMPVVLARADHSPFRQSRSPSSVVPVGPPSDEDFGVVDPEDGVPTVFPQRLFDKRCLAVWLFDESRSMRDDQRLVRQKVEELYDNIGANRPEARRVKKVMTAVCSYGKEFHVELAKPTDEMDEIRGAIDRIPVDDTGVENHLMAVNRALSGYSEYAQRYERAFVLILVTDEGGDDDVPPKEGEPSMLELTIAHMKKLNASLVVFGNESGAFGYPTEYFTDPDPPKGFSAWTSINRGIDTGAPEMFRHDWYWRRTGRVASGFGPYTLGRLCTETGGIYYLLRDDSLRVYDYEKLLGGYRPELCSREELAARDRANPVRDAIAKIIAEWEAILTREGLGFQHVFRDNDAAAKQMETSIKTIDAWTRLMDEGIRRINALGNVNFEHAPDRWRANRDLMFAQMHKLRFELCQNRLTLVELMRNTRLPQEMRTIPPIGSGGYYISSGGALRGNPEENAAEVRRVQELYQQVIDTHPRTPWAVFAAGEMRGIRGFSIRPWSPGRGGPGRPASPQ